MAYINVIVPVYNSEKYLLDTVFSILNQPEKDIEIVLIDDGSTDGSAKMCDELAEKENRVKVIHKANGGVSSARNVGIEYYLKKNTRGYIAFCDADDVWMTNAIESTLIKEIKKEDADIVGFSMYCSNEDMTRFYISNQYEKKIVTRIKYKSEHLFGGGQFCGTYIQYKTLFGEFDSVC